MRETHEAAKATRSPCRDRASRAHGPAQRRARQGEDAGGRHGEEGRFGEQGAWDESVHDGSSSRAAT